jgi:hypothetical protein
MNRHGTTRHSTRPTGPLTSSPPLAAINRQDERRTHTHTRSPSSGPHSARDRSPATIFSGVRGSRKGRTTLTSPLVPACNRPERLFASTRTGIGRPAADERSLHPGNETSGGGRSMHGAGGGSEHEPTPPPDPSPLCLLPLTLQRGNLALWR